MRLVSDATIEFFGDLDLAGDVAQTQTLERFSVRWVGDAPVDGRFSARVIASFTPDVDGEWTFSLFAAGRARLFVDDELLIDNWTAPEPGEGMFGLASAEQKAIVDMAAGHSYALRIEYRSRAPMAAGFHVGCLPPGADDLGRAVAAARRADAAVVVCGTNGDWETEGRDRESMDLPGRQDELIRAVAEANPRTVVVIVTGAPVTMTWTDHVPAVLQAFFGGQEAGHAIADVLFGGTNPCGKLPTTFPVRYEDNPAFVNYPGEGGAVRYGEGIFVGYRYYDHKDVAPRFCFGHGLSYTTFVYGPLRVEREAINRGDDIVAAVDVTNTGACAGKEVVQLYVGDDRSSFARPPRELKAFHKIALEPGETKTVTFRLDEHALSFWNPVDHEWTAEPGDFVLECGSSSRDIRAQRRVTLLAP
jgi:beta-glucosidase